MLLHVQVRPRATGVIVGSYVPSGAMRIHRTAPDLVKAIGTVTLAKCGKHGVCGGRSAWNTRYSDAYLGVSQ